MEKKRILIIKMTAIGDVIIALPHIEVIVNYHPNETIWLLTSKLCENLFKHHPNLIISSLVRYKPFSRDGFWATLLWIRKKKFDRIYDLQGNRISRLLTRFSGSSFRVGTYPYPLYTHFPPGKYSRMTHQNIFELLNETLKSAGLNPAEKKARIYLDDDDIVKVDQWKRQHGLEDKKYVVMYAGSTGDMLSKRWPADHFLKLAKMIETQGLKCIWVGSESEIEINAYLSSKIGIDSTDVFNLRELYEFGKRALFAVSCDSCPMHLFAASGIPVYAFFGPTNWRRSYPLGQKDRVLIKEVECSPCFRGICPENKGHKCLSGISAEAVFQRIEKEFHFIKGNQV